MLATIARLLLAAALIGSTFATAPMIQGQQAGDQKADADNPADLLIGCWTSSYEDKKKWDDPEIFLRSDAKDWPPSRFRMRYVFKKDGSCQYLYLAPNDAHKMVDGTWKVDGKRVLIADPAGNLQQGVSFELVELIKDKLTFKRLSK